MLVKEQPERHQETSFHTQGPLPPDSGHLYIPRRADEELERLIARREYVVLIGPRLSGKSSMLLRQWARLTKAPMHVPVLIRLGQLQTLDNEEWFSQIHLQIAHQSDGLMDVPEHPAFRMITLYQALVKAIEADRTGRILVIMLDNVENTPEAVCTEFYSQVRELFIQRTTQPKLKQIVFVLAGRFDPAELVKDPAYSPFRVAGNIHLEDADLEGTTQLVAMLGSERRQIASNVPARVFEWTDGDVYLTHLLCAGLAQEIQEGQIHLADVDHATRRYLFEDKMFHRMWDVIQGDPDLASLMNTLLEHRKMVKFTRIKKPIMQTWLEGAIKADPNGHCVMHSQVHESVLYSMQNTRAGYPKPRRSHVADMHDNQTVLRQRYRLDAVIHPGLTSYLYRATDLETGETVAVKQLMVTRKLNEIAWQRFQREADALKHLKHPHIVQLLDAFSEDSLEYIVMEYVNGGSLFEHLNSEGRMPLRTALDISLKVASALDHAHSQDIIHRDVKPANVMLTTDLQPRLADFGIARLNYHARVTLPNRVVGTPAYLSPEGIQGETTDPRSDIWALGVMLFEMLAGTPPFMGNTDEMIARAILAEPPPDIRQIRPDVPDAVVNLIDHMLAKSPTHRMGSAYEAHEALRGVLAQLL
ncbi:MAG: serine/threonine protein kinase [Anaerolineae bacterium]|nr:serine/threonine protein kinase [Anaerolineae bacterium]